MTTGESASSHPSPRPGYPSERELREESNGEHAREDEYDVADPYERVHDHEQSGDDRGARENAKGHPNEAFTWRSWLLDDEEEMIAPAVILPWRIALFLFTSTLVQNFSYSMTSFMNAFNTDWSAGEKRQFSQLAFNMIYLGPVFGLIVDLFRVFGERYRPSIVVACVVNVTLCSLCVAIPTMNAHYGRSLIIEWLMQVATMFIYMPMNAVVISYGNSMLESADESSARIGGLMAQAMVVRTFGSLIYQFVYVFGRPKMGTQPDRWMLLIAAIGSFVLILQVICPLTMKRSYFVDRREANLKHSAPVRFYLSAIRTHRNALSRSKKPANSTFMYILCFVFIYFMVPDTLYNTIFSFNPAVSRGFSRGLNQAISILGSLGALLGSIAYALWMYFSYEHERKHRRVAKTNPFQIVLAGCSAWAFGTLFHLFGVAAYNVTSFSWKVFIPFQSCIVAMCLRFAFMPTLSLAAMHAPRGYETTAFELFSVDTSGGGVVSSAVTDSLMSSMGVTQSGMTNWSAYWKVVLICIFFQYLPALIALSLPKYRDEDESSKAAATADCEPIPNERDELNRV